MVAAMRYAALALPLVCLASRPAFAEGGYAEAVVGMAIPIADDDYEDLDDAFKFGLRLGSGHGPTAVELSADYTPFDVDGNSDDSLDFTFDRFRVLVGVRHRVPLGSVKGGQLFLRGGVGADIVHYAVDGTIIVPIDYSDTDPGIAAELGAGFVIGLGPKAYLGGQLAVPMGFHFDDEQDDAADTDLDYTGVDIDLLFTVGARI